MESRSLASYLVTHHASWYSITIVVEIITFIWVLTIQENVYPWIFVRNFLGLGFVLFIPGYAFTKALFPFNLSFSKDIEKMNIGKIERLTLSFCLSFALVSIVGLILYYVGLFSLFYSLLVLMILTTALATIGVIREKNSLQLC